MAKFLSRIYIKCSQGTNATRLYKFVELTHAMTTNIRTLSENIAAVTSKMGAIYDKVDALETKLIERINNNETAVVQKITENSKMMSNLNEKHELVNKCVESLTLEINTLREENKAHSWLMGQMKRQIDSHETESADITSSSMAWTNSRRIPVKLSLRFSKILTYQYKLMDVTIFTELVKPIMNDHAPSL